MKKVTVRNLPGHTYAMEVEDERHTFVMDEGREDGGEDLGPTPYELLLSALGGCTAITLLMYAKRKGWEIEDITVALTQDKVHPRNNPAFSEIEAEDAGPNGRLDLITMQVLVKGNLEPDQYDRLLEIADRCPVHRTLQSPTKIVSELVRVD